MESFSYMQGNENDNHRSYLDGTNEFWGKTENDNLYM